MEEERLAFEEKQQKAEIFREQAIASQKKELEAKMLQDQAALEKQKETALAKVEKKVAAIEADAEMTDADKKTDLDELNEEHDDQGAK